MSADERHAAAVRALEHLARSDSSVSHLAEALRLDRSEATALRLGADLRARGRRAAGGSCDAIAASIADDYCDAADLVESWGVPAP